MYILCQVVTRWIQKVYPFCHMLGISDIFWIRMKYLKFVKYYKFDSQLINEAGISEGSWNYWRTSNRLPTIQGILAISQTLGVKVGWLLGEIPMESLESDGLTR